MNAVIATMVVSQVLSWAPLAEETVDNRIELSTVLALIHVESTGDPEATNGSYCGLMQIGDPYLEDALTYGGQAVMPAVELIGDAHTSLKAFSWYMQRWDHIHRWDPRYVALLHKAGPQVTRQVIDETAAGSTLIESAAKSVYPESGEYITRFDRLKSAYEIEIESNKLSTGSES